MLHQTYGDDSVKQHAVIIETVCVCVRERAKQRRKKGAFGKVACLVGSPAEAPEITARAAAAKAGRKAANLKSSR